MHLLCLVFPVCLNMWTGVQLFNSSAKLESGTGWPSFYAAFAGEACPVCFEIK